MINENILNTWPPTENEIKKIATESFYKSDKTNIIVLVYWNNPSLLIFDPVNYANTTYLNYTCNIDERIVNIIVGKED